MTAPGNVTTDNNNPCGNRVLVTIAPWDPWIITAVVNFPTSDNYVNWLFELARASDAASIGSFSIIPDPFSDPPLLNIGSAQVPYTPGQDYTISMIWDGTNIHYELDGITVATDDAWPTPYPGQLEFLIQCNFGNALNNLKRVLLSNI